MFVTHVCHTCLSHMFVTHVCHTCLPHMFRAFCVFRFFFVCVLLCCVLFSHETKYVDFMIAVWLTIKFWDVMGV